MATPDYKQGSQRSMGKGSKRHTLGDSLQEGRGNQNSLNRNKHTSGKGGKIVKVKTSKKPRKVSTESKKVGMNRGPGKPSLKPRPKKGLGYTKKK
jgi:hypothetical protein